MMTAVFYKNQYFGLQFPENIPELKTLMYKRSFCVFPESKDVNNIGWYLKFTMQLLLPQNNNIYMGLDI